MHFIQDRKAYKTTERGDGVTASNQAGATLIEVLVALLVFATGIYGVAAFQLQSVKESLDSSQRSQAIWAAQGMIDRVRLNPAGHTAGDYNNVFNAVNCNNANPPNDCAAGTCTAAQMAVFDAWETQCESGALIANASFTLACADVDPGDGITCTAGSNFTFTVTWQSRSVTDDQEDASYDETAMQTQTFTQVFRP